MSRCSSATHSPGRIPVAAALRSDASSAAGARVGGRLGDARDQSGQAGVTARHTPTRQPSRPRARPRRRRGRRTRAGMNARSQATDQRLTTTTRRAVACFVIRQQPAGTRRVHQTGYSRVCAGAANMLRGPDFGKEGVYGSSPSEGFGVPPAQALFVLSRPAMTEGCGVHRTSIAWTSVDSAVL